MSELRTEISRRRTFAIISHPDAGKTTLTEKFLLYGGAIAQAGEVKGKRARAATSDWMEIEKQRGISVTSSVLQFQHSGFCINILDTPGHQDFSEDTYRTLMAADSAVMVIDGAKGVEPQTRKLFRVCAIRHIPIFTFINKMDRETKDPLELCEEVERELGIDTYAVNWPIGSGKEFQGVYDREKQRILFFQAEERGKKVGSAEVALDDPALEDMIGAQKAAALREEVELLGAGREFDMEAVRNGTLSPVFFGSALTTFGVEPFLEEFLRMTTPPLPRVSDQGEVDVFSEDFSAFVFKIQANMNKAHRDRLAFMRICSGKFERDTEYFHVQGNKKLRLSQPQQMMAAEREIIDEAYAGDIIGVFDPGIFSIGDTVTVPGKKFKFSGIPTFEPEHFMRVSPKVHQGHGADRPGGRHPDFQAARRRPGGGHRGRRGHPAVRRVPVPDEERVRRRALHGGTALRAPAGHHRLPLQAGGSGAVHRRRPAGGLQGPPAGGIRRGVVRGLSHQAQPRPGAGRVPVCLSLKPSAGKRRTVFCFSFFRLSPFRRKPHPNK